MARQRGDKFQARVFWLNAACLLDPSRNVTRVAYETGPKAFDDVLVEYDIDRPRRDHEGHPYYRSHVQCKWHTNPGAFGFTDLLEPQFINADRISFLQRVHEVQQAYAPDGLGCRFELLTNWRIAPEDPLIKLVDKGSNAIRLDRLFEGKTDRSRMGRVRKAWREHLGIDDDALRLVARVLSISESPESLDDLRERLDDRFAAVGLKRFPAYQSAFPYDALTWELHDQGRIDFDPEGFKEMIRGEGLLDAPPAAEDVLAVGIRSFMHPIDNLESRCDRMLNLVPYFDGRYIRDPTTWHRHVLPELRTFVLDAARASDRLRLVLDAHVSLAFAVGSILDVKSGMAIEIEQRTGGRRSWSTGEATADTAWPALVFEDEDLASPCQEVAVAVSLTHDVSLAVRAFALRELPHVGRILHCVPEDGVSHQVVRSGQHAWQLAEAIAQRVSSLPLAARPPVRVHLFIAAPNGFTFFLGQHHKALGPATVYEWDFEGERGGSYSPGLSIGP